MEKNKTGRPRIDIDQRTFESLCAIHCTEEEIAGVLKCSVDTIERWCKRTYTNDDGEPMTFAEVFNKLSANGKASLRRQQWRLAESGDRTMLIWLGKQWLGQKDIQDIQVTNNESQNKFAEVLELWIEGNEE